MKGEHLRQYARAVVVAVRDVNPDQPSFTSEQCRQVLRRTVFNALLGHQANIHRLTPLSVVPEEGHDNHSTEPQQPTSIQVWQLGSRKTELDCARLTWFTFDQPARVERLDHLVYDGRRHAKEPPTSASAVRLPVLTGGYLSSVERTRRTGRVVQFSSVSPFTRPNSAMLFVTSLSPRLRA